MRAVSTRIAILGAGRLGESMLRGFLSSGWRSPADLVATAGARSALAELPSTTGSRRPGDNTAAVRRRRS